MKQWRMYICSLEITGQTVFLVRHSQKLAEVDLGDPESLRILIRELRGIYKRGKLGIATEYQAEFEMLPGLKTSLDKELNSFLSHLWTKS
jgi:hypothetical protein